MVRFILEYFWRSKQTWCTYTYLVRELSRVFYGGQNEKGIFTVLAIRKKEDFVMGGGVSGIRFAPFTEGYCEHFYSEGLKLI